MVALGVALACAGQRTNIAAHTHTHRDNMLHTRQDNTQNLLNTNNKESAFKATAKQRGMGECDWNWVCTGRTTRQLNCITDITQDKQRTDRETDRRDKDVACVAHFEWNSKLLAY